MTPREWCSRLEVAGGSGIRIVGHVPADVRDEEVAAFATGASQAGFVPIDAHRPLPEDQRRRLWHCHLALIHRGSATPVSVRWIRELCAASTRAHVVLAIAAPSDRGYEATKAINVTRESAPAAPQRPLEDRAERFWRRERRTSAIRWAGAAVERAHRRGDQVGAGRSYARLVEFSDIRSAAAAKALIARGHGLLSKSRPLAARSHVVAALSALWMTHGDFDAASAALAAVNVECVLSAIPVPTWIRAAQCELACWQGRWNDVSEWSREPELFGWRAVAAFARWDWGALRGTADAASTTAPGGCQEWQALVSMMACSAGDRRHRIDEAVERVRRQRGPARWRDALVLECLRETGSDGMAAAWIREMAPRARGPAEALLWRRVCGGSWALIESEIQRYGAQGIRRWGQRRPDMHMWAGVSALLRQVHEADDAGTAMRRGCRWAREYTGVDAVGIVSGEGSIVTCDPEDRQRASWAAGQMEAVRYGGARIGDVVFQGTGSDAAEVRGVASALATVCAPALRAHLDEVQVSRAGETLTGDILGVSPAIRHLREAVARAAASSFPVLIEGESGTGKELVARAVHRLSARRDRRWAAVNCAALTDELLEAELFGHVRGAFTGAVGPRLGLLEDAHEGTLFLDEVAELSPRAQAKLLRVLQEGEIRRVGENGARRVDVRLVAATNRSLADAARQGAYRDDLIFRLAVIRLRVPPLRERIEDVPLLAQTFWRRTADRVSTHAVLAPDAIAALCRATWAGNVRELQNVIAALAVKAPSRGRIGARHVLAVLAERATPDQGEPAVTLAAARQLSDRRVVAASLARHANRRAAAARELGVSRQGLAKLIARLNLDAVASGAPFR